VAAAAAGDPHAGVPGAPPLAGQPQRPPEGGRTGGTGDPQLMAQARELETLLASDPDNYDTLVHAGNVQYDMGNYVKARELYERARVIRDDSPDLLTDLGVCYREADPKKALEMFSRAAAMSPSHWQSRFNSMVVLYNDLKDPAGARRQLGELKRLQATVPGIPPLAGWEQELAKAGS
jgi:tetratricopeptide (TPR) repeat protein